MVIIPSPSSLHSRSITAVLQVNKGGSPKVTSQVVVQLLASRIVTEYMPAASPEKLGPDCHGLPSKLYSYPAVPPLAMIAILPSVPSLQSGSVGVNSHVNWVGSSISTAHILIQLVLPIFRI